MKERQEKPIEKSSTEAPTIFQMLRSFTSELTTYVKNGAPNVSEENYEKRLAICRGCEHLDEKLMRCKLCGCLIQHKAKWKTTTCPDKPSRWEKENIEIKK